MALVFRFLLLAMTVHVSSAFAADVSSWPDLSRAPSGTTADRGSDVALVVAVEDYDRLPDVPGAKANGDAWAAWLRARGFAVVKQVSDGDATREGIMDAAKIVRDRRRSGGSVWLVYVGHGSPGDGGGSLVGVDARPTAASLDARSLPQSELLAALGADDGIPVIAVVDACFSGNSGSGRLTTEALQPMRAVELAAPDSSAVLVAARGDQYAGPLPGLNRPAFSWLMLGAMRGWADRNRDGSVTASEALEWSSDRMAEIITTRVQQPDSSGSLDRSLARARESSPDLLALAQRTPERPVAAKVSVAAPAPARAAPPAATPATAKPAAGPRVEDLLAQEFTALPTDQLDVRVTAQPCEMSLRISSEWTVKAAFTDSLPFTPSLQHQTWLAPDSSIQLGVVCVKAETSSIAAWLRAARDVLPTTAGIKDYEELGHGISEFRGQPAAWVSFRARDANKPGQYDHYCLYSLEGTSHRRIIEMIIHTDDAEEFRPLARAVLDSVRFE